MIARHDLAESVLAAQLAFRAIMDASARPGSPQPITAVPDAPAPLSGETAAIVLTLFDQDTPVWLDERLAAAPEVASWVRFRTGAPIVAEPNSSAFALIGDAARLPALDRFNQGSAEYPDRSTTAHPAGGGLRARRGDGSDGPRNPRCPAVLRRPAAPRHVRTHRRQPVAVSARRRSAAGRAQPDRGAAAVGPLEERLKMYVAAKGGERAIENAHRLLAHERRGDPAVPELSLAQISEQLTLAVDRVMSEGSLYDRELAALAIKQARGDLIEAIFLLRAFRATLPRLGTTEPVDTGTMTVDRRISAAFKDLPGGQVLGPTFDYTHRLLDPELAEPSDVPEPATASLPGDAMPRVSDLLAADDLIEPSPAADGANPVGDLTREPLAFPAERDLRLQNLARGDEGFLLALGYSTQRGYGRTHPFAGEIRLGEVEVEYFAEEVGFALPLGRIVMTECQMINQFRGSQTEAPKFTRGYGLIFGRGERKAMTMALVDRALRARELGEEAKAPAQDEEFVLSHSDNVQATGFVEHLKLPHYVDFQAELGLVRRMRAEHASAADGRLAMKEAAE